ncbi:hypothetical protein MUK42_14259, partial [Musa troglodytarum]
MNRCCVRMEGARTKAGRVFVNQCYQQSEMLSFSMLVSHVRGSNIYQFGSFLFPAKADTELDHEMKAPGVHCSGHNMLRSVPVVTVCLGT